MIETRRFKNAVIFIQTILNFQCAIEKVGFPFKRTNYVNIQGIMTV